MPYQKYVTDKKELQQLRGSKYVTSDTKKTFSQVKEFLEEGKKILYIGVPCQIGGLKKLKL
jgi:coenzyme F420-reducing hydrogenase beta subunit